MLAPKFTSLFLLLTFSCRHNSGISKPSLLDSHSLAQWLSLSPSVCFLDFILLLLLFGIGSSALSSDNL